MVNGGPSVGAFLASRAAVDAVSLTGSTGAGVAVAKAGAPVLRRLHLELGGNDAAVILEDADLELVLSEVIPGRLLMNGQSCVSNKRLVVHRSVADDLVAGLVERLRDVHPEDPLATEARLGPLIDERAAARVTDQVARAVREGARLVLGSAAHEGPFVEPHVLADVPATAGVARDDEVFGPVFTVVPVLSAAEAIEVTNASPFGLMASVFSRDVTRALAVAERLETGGAVINGTGNYRPPFVPFGGVKLGGSGREGVGYTLEELTRTRFTVLRRIRRAVPD